LGKGAVEDIWNLGQKFTGSCRKRNVEELYDLNSLANNINLSNAELNPIRHLLALFGAHHILHVSRIRVKKIK